MRLQHLLEDAKFDKDFRRIANTILEDIIDELEHVRRLSDVLRNARTERVVDEMEIGENYIIDVPELLNRDDEYADFILWLKDDGGGSQGAFGNTKLGRTIFLDVNAINRVIQRMEPEKKEKITHRSFMTAALKNKKLNQYFVHEYTHLFDDVRSGGNLKSSYSDWEDYYNSSDEINAFYQETMDRIDKTIDQLYAENRQRILSSFEEFRKFFFSFMDRDFKEYMSEDTRRTITKRLYKAYDYFLDEYNL